MTDPQALTDEEVRLVEMVMKYKALAKLFINDIGNMGDANVEITTKAINSLYKCCDKLNVFLGDYEHHI